MNFILNDEQQQLAESLARLLNDQCTFEQRCAIAATDRGASEALWGHLAELGVTALGIPESCGGLGGGNADRMPVMQALGRHLATEPYLSSVVLAATAIREAGSTSQQGALLTGVASGELLIAWAHDEPGAYQTDPWIETQARRVGDVWRLDGLKHLVLHAGLAQHYVVSARVNGQPGDEHGIALFLVEAGAQGSALRSYRLIDDTPAGELTLNAVTGIPLGDTTDDRRALTALRATLAAGTAAVCADMVGAMEAAFSMTTTYVNQRKQFGRLIGEYQSMRHRVADMNVSLEVARSMAFAAAMSADNPQSSEFAEDLPRAKLVIGRQARSLGQAAIQSHGGIGMTEEYGVGHFLRRIHVLDQLFGNVDAQANRLARMGA